MASRRAANTCFSIHHCGLKRPTRGCRTLYSLKKNVFGRAGKTLKLAARSHALTHLLQTIHYLRLLYRWNEVRLAGLCHMIISLFKKLAHTDHYTQHIMYLFCKFTACSLLSITWSSLVAVNEAVHTSCCLSVEYLTLAPAVTEL